MRAFTTAMRVSIGVLTLALAACGSGGSPEDQVRALLKAAESAAEQRDLSDVMDLVADDYADTQGLDKARIRDLMRGYFLLNQSVHLLMRVEEIQFPAERLATVRVTVGMLGRQAEGASDDWKLAADIYTFDLRLLNKAGEWRLISADWRRG